MKGYRTITWNLANAAILAMDAAKVGYEIPEAWEPYWLGVYVFGNIVLRYLTTTPMGEKE